MAGRGSLCLAASRSLASGQLPPSGRRARRAPLSGSSPANSGKGPYTTRLGSALLASPLTEHDDAASLVRQACSGHPLGSSERRVSRHFREYRRVAAERQQRLCSQKAGHRFRTKPIEGRTSRKLGSHVARTGLRTNHQAQACVDRVFLRGTRRLVTCDIYMRAVMPVAGRVCATARTRGMPCALQGGRTGHWPVSTDTVPMYHCRPGLPKWRWFRTRPLVTGTVV